MLEYFESDLPVLKGLPTVSYFAEKLNLSANYFGDLIKKETGNAAYDYIQNKVIAIAKGKILESSQTISEIAFEIGFKYQQHFSRVFKKKTGMTPMEYRSRN